MLPPPQLLSWLRRAPPLHLPFCLHPVTLPCLTFAPSLHAALTGAPASGQAGERQAHGGGAVGQGEPQATLDAAFAAMQHFIARSGQ